MSSASSTSPSTSKILSSSAVHEICVSILDKLTTYEQSWPFIESVDINTPGLENYNNIIHNPMHLSIVKLKLVDNEYRKLSQFIDDLNLIWNNCYLFNDKNSEICDFADYLSKIFNKLIIKKFGGYKSNDDDTNEKGIIIDIPIEESNEIIRIEPLSKNDSICTICEEKESERPLLCCDGVCGRSFHINCLGINQPNDEKWSCHNCTIKHLRCFACGETGRLKIDEFYNGDELIACRDYQSTTHGFKCNIDGCNRYYHLQCVHNMPYTRPLKFPPDFPILNYADENGITNSTKGKTRDPSKDRQKIKNPFEIAKIYSEYYQSKGSKYSRFFVCPSHTCYNSCNDPNPALLRCFRCPYTSHANCLNENDVKLSASFVLCSKHTNFPPPKYEKILPPIHSRYNKKDYKNLPKNEHSDVNPIKIKLEPLKIDNVNLIPLSDYKQSNYSRVSLFDSIKNTAETTSMNSATLTNALNVLQNTKDSMPIVIKHIKSTTFFKNVMLDVSNTALPSNIKQSNYHALNQELDCKEMYPSVYSDPKRFFDSRFNNLDQLNPNLANIYLSSKLQFPESLPKANSKYFDFSFDANSVSCPDKFLKATTSSFNTNLNPMDKSDTVNTWFQITEDDHIKLSTDYLELVNNVSKLDSIKQIKATKREKPIISAESEKSVKKAKPNNPEVSPIARPPSPSPHTEFKHAKVLLTPAQAKNNNALFVETPAYELKSQNTGTTKNKVEAVRSTETPRRVGRPPKVKNEISESDSDSNHSNPPKRGRPKKNLDESNFEGDSSKRSGRPSKTEDLIPRRGRPPKKLNKSSTDFDELKPIKGLPSKNVSFNAEDEAPTRRGRPFKNKLSKSNSGEEVKSEQLNSTPLKARGRLSKNKSTKTRDIKTDEAADPSHESSRLESEDINSSAEDNSSELEFDYYNAAFPSDSIDSISMDTHGPIDSISMDDSISTDTLGLPNIDVSAYIDELSVSILKSYEDNMDIEF